jgi:hypothetical protein
MSKGALAQRIEILEAQLAAALDGTEPNKAESPNLTRAKALCTA